MRTRFAPGCLAKLRVSDGVPGLVIANGAMSAPVPIRAVRRRGQVLVVPDLHPGAGKPGRRRRFCEAVLGARRGPLLLNGIEVRGRSSLTIADRSMLAGSVEIEASGDAGVSFACDTSSVFATLLGRSYLTCVGAHLVRRLRVRMAGDASVTGLAVTEELDVENERDSSVVYLSRSRSCACSYNGVPVPVPAAATAAAPVVALPRRAPGDGSVPVPRPEDEKADEAGDGCVTCAARLPKTVCVPCGHRAMCVACSRRLVEDYARCPVCRQLVDMIIRVYDA
jgi:hypothetical protein